MKRFLRVTAAMVALVAVAALLGPTGGGAIALARGAVDMSHPTLVAAGPRRPFPQHVRYPRRVLLPDVRQQVLDRTALRFWDAWRHRYLRTEGGDGTWVEHDDEPSTVSEGIGYGMIFAAYFADRGVFDALYRYFRNHPSVYSRDLMAWKQVLRRRPSNGGVSRPEMVDVDGKDSATDGDLDIAYALLLAHRQWGSRGSVDYLTQARRVSRAVMAHEVNHRFWNLTPGDWVTGSDARHTRPSDFMPEHFLAFAAADPPKARQWRKVYRTTARIVLAQVRRGLDARPGEGSGRPTGLMPDFMVRHMGRWVPVAGRYLETRHDGDFFYNACRTPWRLSMPYLVAGRTEFRPATRAFARWSRVRTHGRPAHLVAGYFVRNGPNGAPFEDYQDLSFTAPAAVGAMSGGASGQRWLDRLWHAITPRRTTTNYYSDSLRLMALLVLSRNWWQP